MPKKVAKGIKRAADRASRPLNPKSVDDGQMYARTTKMLGHGRLMCMCEDAIERIGKIRGSMRRSEWISVGDVVLVSLREFQDTKCDVLMRYSLDEVRKLKRLGGLDVALLSVDHPGEADDDTNENLLDFEYGDADVEAI